MIKESGGSVRQLGKDELETDIVRERKQIGLSLCNSAVMSLVIAELLIDGHTIDPSQKIVCLNMNESNLDFDGPFK